MNQKQGQSVPDYIALGFEQIDRDLGFLMECFREVLADLGHAELAAHLPWTAGASAEEKLPPQLGLVYAVAFQLLNMVEEQAAASMRALREESEGVAAERGLWGDEFTRLKALGFPAAEIATMMADVRVEPVLTAHPTEAKRLSVLDQHRALFALIEERSKVGASCSNSLRTRTKAALERLWRTGEILL